MAKREGATLAKTGFTGSIIRTEQLPESPEPIPVSSEPGQALSYGEEEKVSVLCGRRKKRALHSERACPRGETKKRRALWR